MSAEVRNLKKLENCDCGLSKLDFRTFCNMQHDIGKILLDLKLLLKGTVSPDIGLYFRFWKKIELPAGPLVVITFFAY